MSNRLEQVLETLRRNEDALRRLGVLHVAVFGSVARGEDRPDSDVDVMVEVDRSIVRSLLDRAGILVLLEQEIGGAVDLADATRLKSHVEAGALADAVSAF